MTTALPKPPWIVAGVEVTLQKNSSRKELRICVPEGCFGELADGQIVEVVNFCETARARFQALLPDWKVAA